MIQYGRNPTEAPLLFQPTRPPRLRMPAHLLRRGTGPGKPRLTDDACRFDGLKHRARAACEDALHRPRSTSKPSLR